MLRKIIKSNQPLVDDSDLRIKKLRESRDLLAATFDLLNDEITGPQWLGKLAHLANCELISCIWWPAGKPDSYLEEASGPELHPSVAWVRRLDELVTAVDPGEAGLLDELNVKAGLFPDDAAEPVFRPDTLIACLDWEPARILIIFGKRHDSPDWQSYDRQRINYLLPIIRKSIGIKKRLSKYRDVTELSSKINDGDSRGVITLMLGAGAIAANQIASKILDNASLIKRNGAQLKFCDPELQSEFDTQLSLLTDMEESRLGEFVWYKNLGQIEQDFTLLLSMRAFQLDNWRRESSSSNRTALITLEKMERQVAPKELQLREYYKLTAAQARFARALMQKASVDAAAETCNISVNTARSHLRAIYQRVGVDSMSKLMQRLSTN